MTDKTALPRMRSWLFAPGDSEKKMGKAIAEQVMLDFGYEFVQ